MSKKDRSKRYYEANKTRLIAASAAWRKADIRREIYHNAKNRAARRGLEFTISIDDIVIPIYCPILSIELKQGVGKVRDSSPSLDRIDPSKGYTPDNIAVISYAANRLKSNMSRDTIFRLYAYVS